jgi:hypothetical protein
MLMSLAWMNATTMATDTLLLGNASTTLNQVGGKVALIWQLIAPFTVEGACNRTVFETWLETCLIPVLRPGQWVIVDNATLNLLACFI